MSRGWGLQRHKRRGQRDAGRTNTHLRYSGFRVTRRSVSLVHLYTTTYTFSKQNLDQHGHFKCPMYSNLSFEMYYKKKLSSEFSVGTRLFLADRIPKLTKSLQHTLQNSLQNPRLSMSRIHQRTFHSCGLRSFFSPVYCWDSATAGPFTWMTYGCERFY